MISKAKISLVQLWTMALYRCGSKDSAVDRVADDSLQDAKFNAVAPFQNGLSCKRQTSNIRESEAYVTTMDGRPGRGTRNNGECEQIVE
jgi:hypothetical protein